MGLQLALYGDARLFWWSTIEDNGSGGKKSESARTGGGEITEKSSNYPGP